MSRSIPAWIVFPIALMLICTCVVTPLLADTDEDLDDVLALGDLVLDIPESVILNPPFEIGKHNIGYANPFGAMVVGAASGNCNTMALVSRMFYYEAKFSESSDRSTFYPTAKIGFDCNELAKRIEADDWGSGQFNVYGYSSLCEMTRSMPIGASATARWVEHECQYRLGLEKKRPSDPAPVNADELVEIYSLVSTLHYISSLPNQITYWLERAITQAISDDDTAGDINLKMVKDATALLKRGQLPILSMFNGKYFSGHVVLGYRLKRRQADNAIDIYVYDSNIQCGGQMDESIIRYHVDTHLMSYMRQDAISGEISEEPMYANEKWYIDREGLSVQVLPGPDENPDLRPLIAETLRHTRLQTGMLFSVGRFLKKLTTESPEDAPLWTNFRDLVLDMQSVQERLNQFNSDWPVMDPNISVTAFNDFLLNNSQVVMKLLFPFILPPGMNIDSATLHFPSGQTNYAHSTIALELQPNSSLDDIVLGLSKSLVFADRDGLANLINQVGSVFSEEKIVLRARVSMKKIKYGDNQYAQYGPVGKLLGSHIIIGDLPTYEPTVFRYHRIEISEKVLSKLSKAVIELAGLSGKRAEFTVLDEVLNFGKLGSKTVKRDAFVEFRGLDVECRQGKLVVVADVGGFVAIAAEDKGLVIEAPRLEMILDIDKVIGAGANRFSVEGSLQATISTKTGLTALGDRLMELGGSRLLKTYVEGAFPLVETSVEDFLNRELASILVLDEDEEIKLKNPVVDIASVNLKEKNFTPASVTAALEPVIINLDASVRKLVGNGTPVTINSIQITNDRLIVELEAMEQPEEQ